jgi:6,7-dimethyl-8-ribityllumazine synthase
LEIPVAIAMATASQKHFDGYVALGCVVRGETTHYETVCSESARGLMDLAIAENLAIGNGILTVEDESQAWERADAAQKDKGGDAARAAVSLSMLRQRFGI